MPRLSLYNPEKSNNYRYIDRVIAEQLQAGATDLYVHKYLGPSQTGPSTDATQPQYDNLDPTNIQDLLFLENRDRVFETDIIRIRGHYNVQNLDFDLSQFGLFLNNDILFITVHYNTMIDLIGRKLMVGDVLELPHLADYNPLNDTVPTSLRRYYQVTDGNYASEGFSATWFPHLWRIKCEPLVDSQEFSQILTAPLEQDNFLGNYDPTVAYTAGYVISSGGANYIAKIDVPAGTLPPNATYWDPDPAQNLKDILSTYNKNIEINDAVLEEAHKNVRLSGYDNTNLYVVPIYGPDSPKVNQPAPDHDVVVSAMGPPGTVVLMRSSNYAVASPAIRISAQTIREMTANMADSALAAFLQMSLESYELPRETIGTGSGSVEREFGIVAMSMGPATGPYATADNTYATSDLTTMSADADPRYQFIARVTPRSFGYLSGWLTGSTHAPNGLPTGTGISFPSSPKVGDYFLRTDFLPQLLYRWDGRRWIRISANVRTETGFTPENLSLRNTFINNQATMTLTDGRVIPQKQPLSTMLTLTPDPLPPR